MNNEKDKLIGSLSTVQPRGYLLDREQTNYNDFWMR